jgi:hypothetical protein
MSVKFGVEKSEHRKWIDEKIDAGMSARAISEDLSVKFGEQISNVSISAFINSLNTEEKIEEKTALEIIAALTARVRNLELNIWKYGQISGQQTAWGTYSIDGRVSHSLKRIEVLTDAMPVTPTDKEYNDLVAAIVERKQKEDGLPLSDAEFVKERARIAKAAKDAEIAKKKELDEQRKAAAKAEIERREKDQKTLLKNIEIRGESAKWPVR